MNLHRMLQSYWIHIVAAATSVVAIILSIFLLTGGQSHGGVESASLDDWLTDDPIDSQEEDQEELEEQTFIVVDVKGAVQLPGIYTLDQGSRVDDAIRAAGGLSEKADPNQLNFAMILHDEMLIYAPVEGEEIDDLVVGGSHPATPQQAGGENGGLININNATEQELETLNGIGPSKAASIITYREENGPFLTIEDLMNVSGIGEKSFEKLKTEIMVK